MPGRCSIRSQALCLAIAVWVVFAWTQASTGMADRFGTLRGMDFLQFYAAGRITGEGSAWRLYDWNAFAAELPNLVPGFGDVLFLPIYPPQTALIFVPFARLPYLAALAAWWLVSALLYVGSCWVLWRSLPALWPFRREAWALALGFPPFVQMIAHGQVGVVAVPLLLVTWLGVRDQRPLLAGVALGSLFFKPQLGTLALAALILLPSVRLLSGLVVGAGAQILLASALFGWEIWTDYTRVALAVATGAGSFEPKIWAMHSLRGLALQIAGHSVAATALWVAAIAAAIALARRAAGRSGSRALTFVALCLLGMLANPHLYVYDLLLLAIPLAVLAGWLAIHRDHSGGPVPLLAYSLVWLPLIGPLAAYTHVQLTAPVMMGLLWALGSIRPPAPAGAAQVPV